MKWALVAMLGLRMEVFDMGSGEPSKERCHALTAGIAANKPTNMPPRLAHLLETEVVEGLACVDEDTLGALASGKFGRSPVLKEDWVTPPINPRPMPAPPQPTDQIEEETPSIAIFPVFKF